MGFSLQGLLLWWSMGSRCRASGLQPMGSEVGARGHLAVTHGLSWPVACGIAGAGIETCPRIGRWSPNTTIKEVQQLLTFHKHPGY